MQQREIIDKKTADGSEVVDSKNEILQQKLYDALRFHTDREWYENDFLPVIINCFEENVALPFPESG